MILNIHLIYDSVMWRLNETRGSDGPEVFDSDESSEEWLGHIRLIMNASAA